MLFLTYTYDNLNNLIFAHCVFSDKSIREIPVKVTPNLKDIYNGQPSAVLHDHIKALETFKYI